MQYVDPNGFEPLPAYLEEALAGLAQNNHLTRDDKAVADELAALGYVSSTSFYIDGTGIAEIAPKGLHYFDEKAAWEARVAAWQQREEEREKGDKRHDWATGIVCVVVGSALTLAIQALLSILRFG